jgi:hypothetical protein
MLKFLLLILVITGVWYGFRYVSRQQGGGRRPPAARPKPENRPEARPQPAAEDMTACRVCGTYVAESTAKSCGRSDCPYPAA